MEEDESTVVRADQFRAVVVYGRGSPAGGGVLRNLFVAP